MRTKEEAHRIAKARARWERAKMATIAAIGEQENAYAAYAAECARADRAEMKRLETRHDLGLPLEDES